MAPRVPPSCWCSTSRRPASIHRSPHPRRRHPFPGGMHRDGDQLRDSRQSDGSSHSPFVSMVCDGAPLVGTGRLEPPPEALPLSGTASPKSSRPVPLRGRRTAAQVSRQASSPAWRPLRLSNPTAKVPLGPGRRAARRSRRVSGPLTLLHAPDLAVDRSDRMAQSRQPIQPHCLGRDDSVRTAAGAVGPRTNAREVAAGMRRLRKEIVLGFSPWHASRPPPRPRSYRSIRGPPTPDRPIRP